MAFNRESAMKQLVLLLVAIGVGLAMASHAQVRVTLPVGGVGASQSVLMPVQIQPSTNLAGVQCDILFDASKLACDRAQFVTGTPGVVVDGANVQSNQFRLLAYAPRGTALTNGVTCALAFRVLPGAAAGEMPLKADTNFVYGSSTLATISSNPPSSGMVTIGDAFVRGDFIVPVSSGMLWQFHATNAPGGSVYVILASTNLITWEPLTTNAVVDGSVFSFDPDAHLFSCRFYRIAPQ